jgi:hypothetical protein
VFEVCEFRVRCGRGSPLGVSVRVFLHTGIVCGVAVAGFPLCCSTRRTSCARRTQVTSLLCSQPCFAAATNMCLGIPFLTAAKSLVREFVIIRLNQTISDAPPSRRDSSQQ